MLSRLVQRNYRDVGGHGLSCGEMTGEMNICVTGELSQYLLNNNNNKHILATHFAATTLGMIFKDFKFSF